MSVCFMFSNSQDLKTAKDWHAQYKSGHLPFEELEGLFGKASEGVIQGKIILAEFELLHAWAMSDPDIQNATVQDVLKSIQGDGETDGQSALMMPCLRRFMMGMEKPEVQ